MAREALTEEQLAAKAVPSTTKTAKEVQAKATPEPKKPKTVTVYAKYGRFIDLVNDVEITSTPQEVEAHPWLQAQIDAGLLIEH